MTMKKYVIIVAGGSGERMGMKQPKQFLELAGRPVLMLTFDAFSFLYGEVEFILVLSSKYIQIWKQLCIDHNFQIPHQITDAGPKRFHSVKNGLRLVPDQALVAIHDAVRPFVAEQVIRNCFDMAERKGNAIPLLPIEESVREVSGSLSKAINRNKLRLVQTPQVFRSESIRLAYQQPYNEKFTDDATVLENNGGQIHVVEGNQENIKITSPTDLAIGNFFSRHHG